MKKIVVSAVGCSLIDFIYPDVDFNNLSFRKYSSRKDGDGGLRPGKLVFTEELSRFTDESYQNILKEITGSKSPATVNLGGPALVSMIHVSQMLDSKYFDVHLFGSIGNDEKANSILDLVRRTPLVTSDFKKTGERPTPFTDVFSDPDFDNGHGERTFVNNIGAAWDYLPEYLDDTFYDSDIVCFGGTALVPKIHDKLAVLLSKAKKNNCITIVNTVYDFRNEKKNLGEKWPLGNDAETLKEIDLLIMDGEESLKISGKSTLNNAADYFITSGCSAFIITNGANDIFAFSGGGLFNKCDLLKLPVSKSVQAELKTEVHKKGDTTGCGDNFVGGIVASIAIQLKRNNNECCDFLESIACGVASGGFACFYIGGTYFEKVRGEKKDLVRFYYDDYLRQINSK
jgi:sugar/nucleoside kinase (ribokinase family)